MTLQKIAAIVFAALLINTAYIGAFAEPTIFYMGNVLLHLALGVVAAVLGVRYLPKLYRLVAAVVIATGAFLTWSGAVLPNQKILWAHIGVGLILVLLAAFHFPKLRTATLVVLIAGIGLYFRPQHELRIVNPTVIPVSMEGEGDGPTSPFWPSSSRTNVKGTIPSDFFMDSKLCGECHKDAYDGWFHSAHHFSSFNNPAYLASVRETREVSPVVRSIR